MSKHAVNDINGWVIVDKPYEMGSTQVVSLLKRLFSPLKIGHGGTLDPLATGVLPIAFGKATRTVPYVMDGVKTYEFSIKFGFETTTDDMEGSPTEISDKMPVLSEISSVLSQFKGSISQMPPAYSALKIDGKRAYDLARSGELVVLKPRMIDVFSLFCHGVEGDLGHFTATVGKGTYIRSLGRDIARAMGARGHIARLHRTVVGQFSIKNAISVEKIKELCYKDFCRDYLVPIKVVLIDILERTLTEFEAADLAHGRKINNKQNAQSGTMFKAVFNDELVAIVRAEGDFLQPVQVFIN